MFHIKLLNTTSSLNNGFLSIEDEEEEGTTNNESTLSNTLSRTALLLLDYKQFLAARRIQKLWRGYQARFEFDRRHKAAIVIQRWWRGFIVRRNYVSGVEAGLQQTLIDYYNTCATKIQALFRGWRTRQTVHDMYSLRRQQFCAAEELINCVAHKLHHLLRTYSIPGVYSLRNSHCLSKVERLLASMSYRFHNDRVTYLHARQAALLNAQCTQFKKNRFYTSVPYSGPNFNSECKPACEETLYASQDMDHRMFKIIAEYEHSKIDTELNTAHKSLAARKLRMHVEKVLARAKQLKRDFCGDVIASMRKWQIFDDRSLKISHNVFRNPENLQHFLNEANKLVDEHNLASCHCKTTTVDTLQCV